MELLEIENLTKYFPVKQGLLKKTGILRAVNGVNIIVRKDSVFAVVGESGCGKSTLGRLVTRLLEPSGGTIRFKGGDIFALQGQKLKEFRKSVQIIFQDPYASLNPRMRIGSAIAEPLKIHRLVPKKDIADRVEDLLLSVGLSSEMMEKYPHEFSGGQRQRICIARALSLSPELIVADEPLSALDVSVQAQILTLLQKLKESYRLSFIFISHDLHIVHYFSDEVAVMYLGEIVEQASTEELFNSPLHPYTELLLASAPNIRSGRKALSGKGMPGTSDVPSPVHIPPGCPFHPRCPKRFDECERVVPPLLDRNGHRVKCLLYR